MNNILHYIYYLTKSLQYCLTALALYTNLCYAQYENVWIFGHNAGLDFNGSGLTAITSNIGESPPTWGEGSASICDANGQLLFYTEGSRVFDREHNLMPNGNNLTGIISINLHTPTSSTAQGTIIIPVPGNPKQYYIFSLTSVEQNGLGNYGRLFYSVVDISLNRGLGDVVAGQKGIPIDSNLTERMSAVVGEHCNIWLLTVSQNSELKAFEITISGINNIPILSNISLNTSAFGCIAVAPDRSKIAITSSGSRYGNITSGTPFLILFDFDPATGRASNEQLLASNQGFGVCFSPDNTKLYFSDYGYSANIFQFDLSAGSLTNIVNSRTEIASTSTITHMKLGPDNKIYFNGLGLDYLSIINAPNESGMSCLPQLNAVSLVPGTSMWVGLPNVVPIVPKFYYDFTQVICANEQYYFNGTLLDQSGIYRDTLVASNGCDSMITLNLVVLPSPEISISIEPYAKPLCMGDTVWCAANGAVNYRWYSNERLGGSSNREYVYLPDLSNEVFVIGTAANGCIDTASIVINTIPCCEVFVPNAFSPNGDGINDEFNVIPHGHIRRYGLEIFNRWGEKVFVSYSLEHKWNGTYKGRPADAGVYFYHLTTECMEGTELQRKGDVVLVR